MSKTQSKQLEDLLKEYNPFPKAKKVSWYKKAYKKLSGNSSNFTVNKKNGPEVSDLVIQQKHEHGMFWGAREPRYKTTVIHITKPNKFKWLSNLKSKVDSYYKSYKTRQHAINMLKENK